jgi:hypothetical protein
MLEGKIHLAKITTHGDFNNTNTCQTNYTTKLNDQASLIASVSITLVCDMNHEYGNHGWTLVLQVLESKIKSLTQLRPFQKISNNY